MFWVATNVFKPCHSSGTRAWPNPVTQAARGRGQTLSLQWHVGVAKPCRSGGMGAWPSGQTQSLRQHVGVASRTQYPHTCCFFSIASTLTLMTGLEVACILLYMEASATSSDGRNVTNCNGNKQKGLYLLKPN